MATEVSIYNKPEDKIILSNADFGELANDANGRIDIDDVRSMDRAKIDRLRKEIVGMKLSSETKEGLKSLLDQVSSVPVVVDPTPSAVQNSQVPAGGNEKKDVPLRNQGFSDLYVVSRLLQLGVGPTVKNESAPKFELGIIKTPISIGKKMLHYSENSAVTIQEMFRKGDNLIFNWIYEKVGVEKKHVDLMLRQLDDTREVISEKGMKQYVDSRKALIDASSILTQVETEAAKTKPDQKIMEKLLNDYVKATDQYHRFELFTRTPGVRVTTTPEFSTIRGDVNNQIGTLNTDASAVETKLKTGERRQKGFEESLKTQDVNITKQDSIVKKAEKTFSEKEKALNIRKDSIRPIEQARLNELQADLKIIEKEEAQHNRSGKGAPPTGLRPYDVIIADIRTKNTEIQAQERVLVSINDGTHTSLVTEKGEFDTAKSALETAKNRKLHLEEGKRASEAKLAKIKEENTKLGTKHTEAQAKLAKLPDLVEMDRLLNIVENSPYTDEKVVAERLLQKMRHDIDPSSHLHAALSGTDTATRRAAIETEKTHRARESLFVQGSELPNWMSEKQKEKILIAREKIGETYSQVDALYKEAKDISTALEKDPKIATAEQFSKEVNIKAGVINDKISRLSPVIDDVIRDVSVAFPGLDRDKILQELKIPAIPNAGGATWMKKWNSAIETHAVNTKAGKGVFGALLLVGSGHAAYDGFKKEGIGGTAKELSDIGLGFIPGYDLMVAVQGTTLGGAGRKLTTEERWIRAGFGVLSLIPIVGTGAKALATSAKVIGAVDKVADGVKVSNAVVKTVDYTVDGARLAGHAATAGVVGSAVYNMATPVFTSKKFNLALVDVNPVESKK